MEFTDLLYIQTLIHVPVVAELFAEGALRRAICEWVPSTDSACGGYDLLLWSAYNIDRSVELGHVHSAEEVQLVLNFLRPALGSTDAASSFEEHTRKIATSVALACSGIQQKRIAMRYGLLIFESGGTGAYLTAEENSGLSPLHYFCTLALQV